MKITVEELAGIIEGTVEGNGRLELTHFAPIEEAGEGALSFIANPKYSHFLNETGATALLVGNDLVTEGVIKPALIRVKDVYSTLSVLLDKFSPPKEKKKGIEQPSFVATSARIASDAFFGAFSYAAENVKIGSGSQIFPQVFLGEDVRIGENTIIYPGVKIYAGCQIGNNCIIHSGAVIGSDGFGFAPQPDGSYKKIPQNGIVVIKDNVEIGANTTIDRATLKATLIEEGVKLDNLIQIAHNVELGRNTAIAAQAGISGSAKIGANCQIGGQVGIVGHITVAEGSLVGAQSGVAKPIQEKNKKWFGSPAVPLNEAIRAQAVFRKLPELLHRLSVLEQDRNLK